MTLRKRASDSDDSDSQSQVDDLLHSETEDDEKVRTTHPIKAFYLPASWWEQLFSVPQQIVFALAGLIGMASFARQIIRVTPKRAGLLTLRNGGRGEQQRVDEWIEDNVPSLWESYKPSWWIPNGHLQTIFSVIGNFNKVDKVDYKRTYLRVPDGGTLALDCTPPEFDGFPDDTPTLVVCHGLTGGSHESYVRNVLAMAVKPVKEGGLGARGVVVNFRGCAGAPVTSPQLYSAGTTVDLAHALHYLRVTYPQSSLHGIGFSLGASVLARYMGESGSKSLLSSGMVLGCPWDLTSMSVKLENDFVTRTIYSKAMAQNLLRMFFGHHERNPAIFEREDSRVKPYLEELSKLRKRRGVTLKMVDNVMVSKLGGPKGEDMWPFKGADEYYAWACPKHFILNVDRPLLSINAFDDPIIDGGALPIDQFQSSSHVFEAITGGGGHLGWFDGPFFSSTKSKSRWIVKPVKEFLKAAFRDLEPQGGEITVSLGKGPGSEPSSSSEDGWNWVKEGGHEVQGGTRVGWKVLDEKDIKGAGESGVLQGL